MRIRGGGGISGGGGGGRMSDITAEVFREWYRL